MKYVCKISFTCSNETKDGAPYIVEIKAGDILKYIRTNEDGLLEFKTFGGESVHLSEEHVECYLAELYSSEDNARDRICKMLDDVVKIEAYVTVLRRQLESIIHDSK